MSCSDIHAERSPSHPPRMGSSFGFDECPTPSTMTGASNSTHRSSRCGSTVRLPSLTRPEPALESGFPMQLPANHRAGPEAQRRRPSSGGGLTVKTAERLGWGSALQASTIMKLLKERVDGCDLDLDFNEFLRLIREEWKLKSYYQTDVGQVSYLLVYRGVAFVVNPVGSDMEQTYLRDLRRFRLRLKGILVTHSPFEYVSSHAKLSAVTGATVYFGENEQRLVGTCSPRCREVPCRASSLIALDPADENVEDEIGGSGSGREGPRLYWRPLPTPGHTIGAVTWLLCRRACEESRRKEQVLLAFTGSTLLVGGIGRTDLESAIHGERSDGAEAMCNSVQALQEALHEGTEVFPSMAAGPCRATGRSLRRSNPFFNSSLHHGAFLEKARRIVQAPACRAPGYYRDVAALNARKWSQRPPRLVFVEKRAAPSVRSRLAAAAAAARPAVNTGDNDEGDGRDAENENGEKVGDNKRTAEATDVVDADVATNGNASIRADSRVQAEPEFTAEVGPPMSIGSFMHAFRAAEARGEAIVVDVRDAEDFCRQHVLGALNFPLDTPGSAVEGFWSVWFGSLVPVGTKVFLVCPTGREQEALNRLQLVGHLAVEAILSPREVAKLCATQSGKVMTCNVAQLRGVTSRCRGGSFSTMASGRSVERSSTPSLAEGADPLLLDVRSQSEFTNCDYWPLAGAKNVPLSEVVASSSRLVGPADRECMVICNNGFRSAIACSFLVKAGFRAVHWVPQGYEAIRHACPEMCGSPNWHRG